MKKGQVSESAVLVMSVIALIVVFIIFFLLYSPNTPIEFNIEEESRHLTMDMMLNNILRTEVDGMNIRDHYSKTYEACSAGKACKQNITSFKGKVQDILDFSEHTFTDVVTEDKEFIDCIATYIIYFNKEKHTSNDPNNPTDEFGRHQKPKGRIFSENVFRGKGSCKNYFSTPDIVSKTILLNDGTPINVTLRVEYVKK
ncbi:MAG: hypothetical protein ACLFP2_00465 [Candidatus Woesearchaeota archaeon]